MTNRIVRGTNKDRMVKVLSAYRDALNAIHNETMYVVNSDGKQYAAAIQRIRRIAEQAFKAAQT